MKHAELNPQEKLVQAFINVLNIDVKTTYAGEQTKDNWVHDVWVFNLHRDGVTEQFTFKTGVGHRELNPRLAGDLRQYAPRESVDYVTWRKQAYEPTIPSAAGLLYNLLSDAEAANNSFMSWCNDYGFSDDSMKAFMVYQQCCETAVRLQKLFTREELMVLAGLLEDYLEDY